MIVFYIKQHKIGYKIKIVLFKFYLAFTVLTVLTLL